jgi:hypothetical protein
MSGAHEITWWGGFDPYTFAVWISLDKVFDLPDSHNAAFLFIRTLVAPASDDHREYVRSLSSDEDRFIAYTAFTAFQHEWRHWYDATSTPFGLYRTGQLAASFSMMAGAYDELAGLATVYSPLVRWLRSPTIVNAVYPNIGKLPPLTAKLLDRALVVLKKADKDLRATATIQGRGISTTQILEGLAMLSQEQAIEDAFGVEAARLVRNSITAKKGGASYYAPIDLVENKGIEDRNMQTQVLESALFANYGAFGSQCPITPPEILRELLDRLRNESRNTDLADILESFRILSFTRREAFEMSYATMYKTMEQIRSTAARLPDQSSHAARVLAALGAGLPSAFMMGGAARFSGELKEELPGTSHVSKASPYDFYPLLVVEGYPGLVTPDSLELPIVTLAGAAFDSGLDAATSIQTLNLTPSNPVDSLQEPGPYTMHAVWTPRPENIAQSPPYFSIFNVFHDLMYWRGLVFGRNLMSPSTYFFTTERTAQNLGQTIVH